MRVFKLLPDWQAWRAKQTQSIGFVATMGALHAGHLALVKESLANNDITVVSIFINPTQFDQAADLDAYPQQLDQDLTMLEAVGVTAVLVPESTQIYVDNQVYKVTESKLSLDLCGEYRPGHFDGMLTVVMRLFSLVQPQRAYFGEKDWQQLQLITGMVKAFFISVEIVAVATMREVDGLAMSSRNIRLSASERIAAASFPAILKTASSAESAVRELIEAGFKVDYVKDMKAAGSLHRLAAVHLGKTRLIDNIGLGHE